MANDQLSGHSLEILLINGLTGVAKESKQDTQAKADTGHYQGEGSNHFQIHAFPHGLGDVSDEVGVGEPANAHPD